LAWVFVVGTLFLMLIGAVSAAYYRWSKVFVASQASGRASDLDEAADLITKAVDRWSRIDQ
jgi:hypothetical protein